MNLQNSTTDLFGPAPDGPVETIRLANAREGIQAAEARVFVEKVLLDEQRPLPADLAARARAALDERTNVLRYWPIRAIEMGRYHWQQRDRALYALAAELAAARR